MIPRWQVEELADALVKNVASANRIVGELRPREWIQDGAPQVYVEQHETLARELEQVRLAALALRREPESLTNTVSAFMWLDRADNLLSSVAGGVRRYYNPAVANLLDSVRNRNGESMATLKEYMRQLAVHVEESLKIAHREAQRCRSEIIARPPA